MKLKVTGYKLQVGSTKYQVLSTKLQLLSLLMILLSVMQTVAQKTDSTKYAFTLQQAIDFALQNQTSVQNAVYDEQIAANKVKEIRGIGLPQANGSIDVKNFLDIPTSVAFASTFNPLAPANELAAFKFGIKYNASFGADISQLLFDGSYLVGLQATKVYLEISKKSTERTKIETVQAVNKAYYSVLVNEDRLKLFDANIKGLKKLFDDTKAMNENGFVEKIDLDRITVAYNNLLVEKEKIIKLFNLGQVLLKYQMGMSQSAELTLTDKLADVKFELNNISSDKFDYTKRIEYSLLQTVESAAKLQLKKDQYSYLPNAAAYASFSRNAFRTDFNLLGKPWYPTSLIGVKIGVPIFDGFQKRSKVQQSKLGLKKAENDLKFVQQSIDLDIASASANLVNSSSSLEIQKKNIELAEEVYRVTKIKYEQGVGSNLEVLTAETSLKEAQTNYYNALYDALIAKVDYDKANGTLLNKK